MILSGDCNLTTSKMISEGNMRISEKMTLKHTSSPAPLLLNLRILPISPLVVHIYTCRLTPSVTEVSKFLIRKPTNQVPARRLATEWERKQSGIQILGSLTGSNAAGMHSYFREG